MSCSCSNVSASSYRVLAVDVGGPAAPRRGEGREEAMFAVQVVATAVELAAGHAAAAAAVVVRDCADLATDRTGGTGPEERTAGSAGAV